MCQIITTYLYENQNDGQKLLLWLNLELVVMNRCMDTKIIRNAKYIHMCKYEHVVALMI